MIETTYGEHDFGPAAMVMLYAGLRRGEVLYLDVDRDADFQKKTLTVRGAVSFCKGNRGVVTEGKTANAQPDHPHGRSAGGGLAGPPWAAADQGGRRHDVAGRL